MNLSRILLATSLWLAPAVAAAQVTTEIDSHSNGKPYTKSGFGARYDYFSAVSATQAAAGNTTSRSASVETSVVVFDHALSAVRSELVASSNAGLGTSSVQHKIYVGSILKKSPITQGPIKTGLGTSYSHTFASYTYTYSVGPVPMYLTVTAKADAFATHYGSLDKTGGQLTLVPQARIGTQLDVGVGIDDVASFGVSGSLHLLTARLNAESDAKWTYSRVGYGFSCVSKDQLSGHLTLDRSRRALDGKIVLFVEALWQRAEKTVFDWTGDSDNDRVWDGVPVALELPALGPAPSGSLPAATSSSHCGAVKAAPKATLTQTVVAR